MRKEGFYVGWVVVIAPDENRFVFKGCSSMRREGCLLRAYFCYPFFCAHSRISCLSCYVGDLFVKLD